MTRWSESGGGRLRSRWKAGYRDAWSIDDEACHARMWAVGFRVIGDLETRAWPDEARPSPVGPWNRLPHQNATPPNGQQGVRSATNMRTRMLPEFIIPPGRASPCALIHDYDQS